VTGAGEESHWEYIAQYDGKDVKITGNNPDADMISMTRVSARVPESVYKKGGKRYRSAASAAMTVS
jgi:hypothetical protein